MRTLNGWEIYLVFRVLGDVIESGDVELELSGLAELSEASAERD